MLLTSTHNLCFFSRNKKNNAYLCKPQFHYRKGGFKGVKIISVCFRDGSFRHGIAATSKRRWCAFVCLLEITQGTFKGNRYTFREEEDNYQNYFCLPSEKGSTLKGGGCEEQIRAE